LDLLINEFVENAIAEKVEFYKAGKTVNKRTGSKERGK
jgi:hypothetical protein